MPTPTGRGRGRGRGSRGGATPRPRKSRSKKAAEVEPTMVSFSPVIGDGLSPYPPSMPGVPQHPVPVPVIEPISQQLPMLPAPHIGLPPSQASPPSIPAHPPEEMSHQPYRRTPPQSEPLSDPPPPLLTQEVQRPHVTSRKCLDSHLSPVSTQSPVPSMQASPSPPPPTLMPPSPGYQIRPHENVVSVDMNTETSRSLPVSEPEISPVSSEEPRQLEKEAQMIAEPALIVTTEVTSESEQTGGVELEVEPAKYESELSLLNRSEPVGDFELVSEQTESRSKVDSNGSADDGATVKDKQNEETERIHQEPDATASLTDQVSEELDTVIGDNPIEGDEEKDSDATSPVEQQPPVLSPKLCEPPGTSVFNFTEDEEPPPPLHMGPDGTPRKPR